jgi:hypothetical protein
MSEDRIKNKECFKKLESIKRADEWVTAANRLGFRITSGGKHPYIDRRTNLESFEFAKIANTGISVGIQSMTSARI